jgi:flagellar biosynthesis/type III secretory pathway chaperone
MKLSVETIAETVEALIFVHEKMIEHAREKTEILKNADMSALEEQIRKEDALVAKMTELEELRLQQVIQFLSDKGIFIGNPTVSQFLGHVDGNGRDRMANLFDRLTEAVLELKRQNSLNQSLIEQSLQFVNVTASLLSPGNEPSNYGHPDESKNRTAFKQRSMFDSKA